MPELELLWTAQEHFTGIAKAYHTPRSILASGLGSVSDAGWPLSVYTVESWDNVRRIEHYDDALGPWVHTAPLPGMGTYLLSPHPYRLSLGALFGDGLVRYLDFPYTTKWQGASLGDYGSELLIHANIWTLRVDPSQPEIDSASLAHYDPVQETQDSEWGRVVGVDDPALATIKDTNVVSLWRVRIGDGRDLLWRGDNGAMSSNYVTIWNASPAASSVAFNGLRIDAAFTVQTNSLTVVEWGEECGIQTGRFWQELPSFRHGGNVASGDLDGDGTSELVWSVGSQLYVFGRSEGGVPFLKAQLSNSDAISLSVTVLDADDDGRAEVWGSVVKDSEGQGTAPGRVWALQP